MGPKPATTHGLFLPRPCLCMMHPMPQDSSSTSTARHRIRCMGYALLIRLQLAATAATWKEHANHGIPGDSKPPLATLHHYSHRLHSWPSQTAPTLTPKLKLLSEVAPCPASGIGKVPRGALRMAVDISWAKAGLGYDKNQLTHHIQGFKGINQAGSSVFGYEPKDIHAVLHHAGS